MAQEVPGYLPCQSRKQASCEFRYGPSSLSSFDREKRMLNSEFGLEVILNTRAAVVKTLVKQGTTYQSRPEWDIWHDTFVNSANTGGVLTIGSKY